MTSLKSHFNDVELCYWYRQLQNIFTTSFRKDTTRTKLLPTLYNLSVAIVTTVEVSDWLFNIQLNGRVYTEPTCQLVIANGVLKTSLSNLQEDSRVLRYVIIVNLIILITSCLIIECRVIWTTHICMYQVLVT